MISLIFFAHHLLCTQTYFFLFNLIENMLMNIIYSKYRYKQNFKHVYLVIVSSASGAEFWSRIFDGHFLI